MRRLLSSSPSDVDATTGVCANGRVYIAPSPGKGKGAFAARKLALGTELGDYRGEVISLDGLHARYGEPRDEDVRWHRAWRAERERRHVGVTGKYVYSAGASPSSDRLRFVDAEDPALSNWTRFINHSRRGNVDDIIDWSDDDEPIVRFVVREDIHPGEEICFDYGDSFFDGDREIVS